MDVVGTVSSAISIFEASGKIVHAAIQFYSDFTNADTTLNRFKESIEEDKMSLEALQELYAALMQEASPRSTKRLKELECLFQHNPNKDHSLYKDVVDAVRWLERKKSKPSGTSTRFLRTLSRSKHQKQDGMSLLQKLRWSATGKRRIEKLITRIDRHKHHVNSVLMIVQG